MLTMLSKLSIVSNLTIVTTWNLADSFLTIYIDAAKHVSQTMQLRWEIKRSILLVKKAENQKCFLLLCSKVSHSNLLVLWENHNKSFDLRSSKIKRNSSIVKTDNHLKKLYLHTKKCRNIVFHCRPKSCGETQASFHAFRAPIHIAEHDFSRSNSENMFWAAILSYKTFHLAH